MLSINDVIVIGPTPPGTGEMYDAIFEDVSKSLRSNASKVFKNTCTYMEKEDVTKSWNKALNEIETSLTKEDREIIRQFGKMLGKTDAEGQLNEIELSLNFLETQIEKAETEKSKNAKLYKSLGIIAGIGIVVILI